jgi:hypothetical protein
MLMKPDEVESLTAARSGAANGTEPSDALRVGRSETGWTARRATCVEGPTERDGMGQDGTTH